MKKVLASALFVSVLAAAAPALAGPGWQSINERQARLDHRIDVGVRNGSLTRAEARSLRAEFHQIARLEARYRATGHRLEAWERRELDARFDRLSERIHYERHDRQGYRGDYRRGRF